MREILDFLVGKKTYIMIVVDAFDQLGILWGWWDEAKLREIIEGALTVGFLRAGVNSSAPAPVPFISAGKLSIPPTVQSWLPLVFLIPLALLVTGCMTYKDLGNGRALKVEKVENLSFFGTDGGFMQLQECDKTVDINTKLSSYEQNCDIRSNWVPISSPSKGGQVLAGLLNLVGMGWIASNVGDGGASANAVSSSSVSVKGGHH